MPQLFQDGRGRLDSSCIPCPAAPHERAVGVGRLTAPNHISKTIPPTIHADPSHPLVCLCCRQSRYLETELLSASARLSIYPPIPGDQL